MDEGEIILKLGQHDEKLRNIELVTTQTSLDVRSLMQQFHTDEGKHLARVPVKTWFIQTTSAAAAAIAGALMALKFGAHK